MARIGFIGLGRMGGAIAGHIRAAGHDLAVWNRTRDKTKALAEAGAHVAETPSAVAERSDIVFTMLTNAAAVDEVLNGADGVFKAARKGLVVIDVSTVPPSASRRWAKAAAALGVDMLDAPVGGSPAVAAKGALGMMVGGEARVLDAVRPILETFTSKIVHAGASGQGSALKLVNNLVLGIAIQASAEALTFARKCGLDPAHVVEITSTGGAQMRTMETRGVKMIERDFKPAFSLDDMHKDISAAHDLAGEVGAVLPAGSVVLEMIRSGRARGDGALDPAALVSVLEALSGVE